MNKNQLNDTAPLRSVDQQQACSARRSTLSLHAVDGALNQPRGVYRKVSVGRIGVDAEIVWEYKTPECWLEASSEEEAKVLSLPNAKATAPNA